MLSSADAQGATLGQAKASIVEQINTWQAAKTQYEATNAALVAETSQYEVAAAKNREWGNSVLPEVARYNAQCSGTGDQNYVNQCNNWKNQLEPIRERYNADVERVNAWKAQLEPKIQTDKAEHDRLVAEWTRIYNLGMENERQGQAYLAKRKQIIDEITQLVNNFNTQCQTAVDSGNKELASETCGQAFDGNAIHQIHIPDFPSPQWTSWGMTKN